MADIQKDEDAEDKEVKEESKSEMDQKRKQLEQAQLKLKSTHSRIAALESSAHLAGIEKQLNGTAPESGQLKTAADVTKTA